MAVYQETKRKTWRFEIWKHGVRVMTRGGFPSQKKAIIAESKESETSNLVNLGFEKLTDERLNDLKINRTPRYYQENYLFLENLKKRWGLKKEISRDDVEQFLNEIAKSKGNQSSNKALRYVKALFNYGLERGWIRFNPAAKVKPKSYTPITRYVPPREDIMKVLEKAKGLDKIYLTLAVQTMCRIRELNYLRWTDVFEDYLILKTRKARNSILTERKYPINQTMRDALSQIPKEGEYVFINPASKDKNPYDYRSKILKTLCKKAGIRQFGYHSLRHFGASLLAESGVPLTDLQALLGHSRISTTDLYVRNLKPSLLEATRKLEEIK